MQNQFTVPQFLEIEPKIIGPITARQFLIMLFTLIMCFMIYRIFLSVIAIVGLGIPMLGFGITLAFAKVNGQPFHFILLNILQTVRKPWLRVWDKRISDHELRAIIKGKTVSEPDPVMFSKSRIEGTRLKELSLVINTGGVYNPNDQETFYGEGEK